MKEVKKYQLGEYGPKYPTMSDKSLAKVLRAIIKVDGKILDSFHEPDAGTYVLYLIEIPIGTEKQFEEISGYTLSEQVVISI